jgi:hypothetical protein
MLSLSAPFVRGLSVLAIGAALVVGHITFAAAGQKQGATTSVSATTTDVTSTGSIGKHEELAENCYFEIERVQTAAGKTTIRRVQECD